VDFDSIFDHHISQIHFDQDSTCSVNNNPKNDISMYTPSPLTTPDIVSGSDPALSPRSNENNESKKERNAEEEVPGVISTFRKDQGMMQQMYPENRKEPFIEPFSQDKNSNIIPPYPTTYDQNLITKTSPTAVNQIPHGLSSETPKIHSPSGDRVFCEDPNFFEQNGMYPPDFQCSHPRQSAPYTYDPFVHDAQDPLAENFNQMKHTFEDSEMTRQKRRLSMPFVSTSQTPRSRFPREMRRFSAPHTTSENQRAMQYAIAAQARNESLTKRMMHSQMSQHCLQDWDRKMGLSKAHSRTMIKTEKSRRKLQKLNSI